MLGEDPTHSHSEWMEQKQAGNQREFRRGSGQRIRGRRRVVQGSHQVTTTLVFDLSNRRYNGGKVNAICPLYISTTNQTTVSLHRLSRLL